MAKAKKENKKVEKEAKVETVEKDSLWARFRNFIHGVKVETKRIHWTTKKDLVKYSVATLVFVVFFSLYFYILDVLFALLHSLI